MLTLFRTVCNTDWKGRPDHHLEKLGTGTREELVAVQDADVLTWQAEDIQQDRQIAVEEVEESGEPVEVVSDIWMRQNQRWEMDRTPKEVADGQMREFAYDYDDGGFSSICYHILDI